MLDEGLQAIADKHEDDRRLNTTVEGFYNAEENAEWTLSLRESNSSLNLGILIALLFTSVVMMGIKYMLASLNKDDGKTIIIVTHDPKIAMKSNTVVFMKDGLLMNRIDKFGDEEQKNLTEEQVEDKFYRNILANIDNL